MSQDDIILWADGTWCYRYELSGMAHMSDDYEVIAYGTDQHELLQAEHSELPMKPSAEQMDRIYQAWRDGLPPIQVATALRLVPMTVIAEFVRLDDESRFNPSNDSGDNHVEGPTH